MAYVEEPTLDSVRYGRQGTPDPLGHTEPLPLHGGSSRSGFPLDLYTNSEDVLAAGAERSG